MARDVSRRVTVRLNGWEDDNLLYLCERFHKSQNELLRWLLNEKAKASRHMDKSNASLRSFRGD